MESWANAVEVDKSQITAAVILQAQKSSMDEHYCMELRLQQNDDVRHFSHPPSIRLLLNTIDHPTLHIYESQNQLPSSIIRPQATAFLHLTRLWLEKCETSHPGCVENLSVPLPTRLVQITASGLQLVNGKDLSLTTKYTTLSHSWGSLEFFTLQKHNIETMYQDIPITKLTRTFRDAISITQQLGIHFLWIDSLCVVQDSHED